jgi:hypothetical protein
MVRFRELRGRSLTVREALVPKRPEALKYPFVGAFGSIFSKQQKRLICIPPQLPLYLRLIPRCAATRSQSIDNVSVGENIDQARQIDPVTVGIPKSCQCEQGLAPQRDLHIAECVRGIGNAHPLAQYFVVHSRFPRFVKHRSHLEFVSRCVQRRL